MSKIISAMLLFIVQLPFSVIKLDHRSTVDKILRCLPERIKPMTRGITLSDTVSLKDGIILKKSPGLKNIGYVIHKKIILLLLLSLCSCLLHSNKICFQMVTDLPLIVIWKLWNKSNNKWSFCPLIFFNKNWSIWPHVAPWIL